jgi:hypothetical protein
MRRAVTDHAVPATKADLIKAIHAMGRDLKLDDDTRKTMQAQLTGCESCKNMTLAQLRTVYSRLRVLSHDAGLGRRGRFEAAQRRAGKRAGRDERQPEETPTKEQLDKIQHLCEHVGLHMGLPYQQLCRRTTRIPECRDGHPFPQTRAEANKVIEALKAMEARGWKARGQAERALFRQEEG